MWGDGAVDRDLIRVLLFVIPLFSVAPLVSGRRCSRKFLYLVGVVHRDVFERGVVILRGTVSFSLEGVLLLQGGSPSLSLEHFFLQQRLVTTLGTWGGCFMQAWSRHVCDNRKIMAPWKSKELVLDALSFKAGTSCWQKAE